MIKRSEMSYSDEDDFEVATDEEFEDSEDLTAAESRSKAVCNVSVTSSAKSVPNHNPTTQYRDADPDNHDIDDGDINFTDLHGKGSSMKLSNLPPESLLRKYKAAINEALLNKKVGLYFSVANHFCPNFVYRNI